MYNLTNTYMPIFKDPELMQEITDGIHDVVFTPATPDLV